jgi:2-methylcitrate dehydratase PrpD
MSLLRSISDGLRSRPALPDAEQQLQRLHVLDAVMAGLAGAHTPEAADLRRLLTAGSIADSAGLNAAMTRLSEIDDIHLLSCVTPSSVTVPTALTLVAQMPEVPPEHVAAAIRAGTDLMVRFGVAIDGAHVLYRGVWPTLQVAPLGAAATAAGLFDLDVEATAHAVALALSASTAAIGRPSDQRTGRWFLFACAVANGVRAAQAARQGLQGDLGLLDGDWLERTRGIRFDPKPLQSQPSASLYSSLGLKPYCTARQCLAAGQAFRSLIEEGLDAAAARAVRVRVPPIYAGMISAKPNRHSRSTTLVGAPLQLALTALRPESRCLVDRTGIQTSETLFRYAERVSVVPDESLQRVFPRQWPAIVEVDSEQGTTSKAVFVVRGDPADRLTEADLVEKAHATLDAVLGRPAVSAWISKAMATFDDASACKRLAMDFAAAMNNNAADSRATVAVTTV